MFRTFGDPICRAIVEAIDEPMSVKEVAEAADVPVSTTYKKLDRLREASLVTRETQLDFGGHHRARFIAFVTVRRVRRTKVGKILTEADDSEIEIAADETIPAE